MNATIAAAAVKLRLGKIQRGLAENLVRPSQLTHLSFQHRQPLLLLRRHPRTLRGIVLRLPHPEP